MDGILATLKALDFSEYEAKVYLALLHSPVDAPAPTGGEVSRRSGVPRSRVYDILSALSARGIAVAVQGEPVRYRPLPPSELVATVRRGALDRLDALEEQLQVLAQQPPAGAVWRLEGAAAVERARAMIAGARRHLALRGQTVGLAPLSADLTAAQERGVQVETLITAPASARDKGALVLVADGSAALLASHEGGMLSGAWITDVGLSGLIGALLASETSARHSTARPALAGVLIPGVPALPSGGTIVAMGSDDPALRLLADWLAHTRDDSVLAVGAPAQASVGALLALARGQTHIAGCHLLDPISGEYNAAAVAWLVPDRPVALINLAARVEGLMVLRGNPKSIRSIEDLARPDVVMVNRQRGAGARVLLDSLLRRAGLTPADLNGYEHEEHNHLGVAAAVATGRADAGLGIEAAARTMGLDFVPLATERYDLAAPQDLLDTPLLAPLLAALRQPGFRDAVGALGGYDTQDTGRIVAMIGGKK